MSIEQCPAKGGYWAGTYTRVNMVLNLNQAVYAYGKTYQPIKVCLSMVLMLCSAGARAKRARWNPKSRLSQQ